MCPEFGCNHSTSGISYPRAPSAHNVAQTAKREEIDQTLRHASTIFAVIRRKCPDLRRILNNVGSRRAQTLKHDPNLRVYPPLRVPASMSLRFFARPALTTAKTSPRSSIEAVFATAMNSKQNKRTIKAVQGRRQRLIVPPKTSRFTRTHVFSRLFATSCDEYVAVTVDGTVSEAAGARPTRGSYERWSFSQRCFRQSMWVPYLTTRRGMIFTSTSDAVFARMTERVSAFSRRTRGKHVRATRARSAV